MTVVADGIYVIYYRRAQGSDVDDVHGLGHHILVQVIEEVYADDTDPLALEEGEGVGGEPVHEVLDHRTLPERVPYSLGTPGMKEPVGFGGVTEHVPDGGDLAVDVTEVGDAGVTGDHVDEFDIIGGTSSIELGEEAGCELTGCYGKEI